MDNQGGHKFNDVFQLKQGRCMDLSTAKISELMKSNSLDNAPTQSLLAVVNDILDEIIDKKSCEIPHRVACLFRRVVQEIERRISTQADHLRTQNNLFKAREEKYQSRIRVLETLASETSEENSEHEKNANVKDSEDFRKIVIEKEQNEALLVELRQEFELEKKRNDELESSMKELSKKQELDTVKRRDEDALNFNKIKEQESELSKRRAEEVLNLIKEKELKDQELLSIRQELELVKSKEEEVDSLIKEKELKDTELLSLRKELDLFKGREEEVLNLIKEKEIKDMELHSLRKELDSIKGREEEVLSVIKETELKDVELQSLRKEIEINKQKDEEALTLMKEKNQLSLEISSIRKELEISKRISEDQLKKTQNKEKIEKELSLLKEEFESTKRANELHLLEKEAERKSTKLQLETRLQDLQKLLEQSKSRVSYLEVHSQSRDKSWNKKQQSLKLFMGTSLKVVKELRSSSKFIKQEILMAQKNQIEDLNVLGAKLKVIVDGTSNYNLVLLENRKLFNELQELKGNIRVYCRIRPFNPGKAERKSVVEFIGENGELIVSNPTKQTKDGRRIFRFNKVYSPNATQADVFSDTQPLIRSVLDGYNVCIFAYGQTGSGKTYTMTGPNGASPEEWGVNYRALNDLFGISETRTGSFVYEVGVQMVEIYNEQVRDLLSTDSSRKKVSIVSSPPPTASAVPDATMHKVTSTSDVLDLMNIGLRNRAVGATAINERSSRSHSIVTIQVAGKDLQNGSVLNGNLHLVDLAGSERVEKSEATGDRLKEAQHINKSLSALGDVIFSLSQRSSHVPYRNSKLTQLLQGSLGGQAKTLMFVQVNPDAESFSETISTLKFAERASGVELGAARSTKDGKDVKELMDQMATLKDSISKKNDEIEKLQVGHHRAPSNISSTSFESVGADDNASSGDGDSEVSDTAIDAPPEEGSKALNKLRRHGKVAARISSLQKAAGLRDSGRSSPSTLKSLNSPKTSTTSRRWV